MNQYRLLLLDVDGTILPIGPNTSIDPVVATALKAAQSEVTVALVSGRSFEWLKDIITSLGLTGPNIANGGSQIINPDGTVLWERPIAHASVERILSVIRPGTTVIVNDSGIEYKNPTDTSFHSPLAIKIQELPAEDIVAYTAVLKNIPDIDFHENASWTEGRSDLYITHAEGTKKYAVLALSKMLGIAPSESIGVGDGKNDIPLLEVCGLKVAMGNAHDDLKMIAGYIAPSVDEHGVADVVQKFILS